jgi:hypothetical protein
MPTALDNGIRSPRRLLASVVRRLVVAARRSSKPSHIPGRRRLGRPNKAQREIDLVRRRKRIGIRVSASAVSHRALFSQFWLASHPQ